jgi:TatD DNase family protein
MILEREPEGGARGSQWTDSHCHLTMEGYGTDLGDVLERAGGHGVSRILCVGTNPEDWEPSRVLASRSGFRSTAGLHPHEASRFNPELLRALGEALAHPEVAAVGETGLDYHYDLSPRDVQKAAFAAQVALAVETRKPLVIHSRSAFEDSLAILRDASPPAGGVLHCFAYGPREAEAFLELGFHVSFSGMATFPKAQDIREAARVVPRDRLLVETDGPYLAPVPYRGKRCEPWHVTITGRFLGEFLGWGAGKLAEATSANAGRLFGPWP